MQVHRKGSWNYRPLQTCDLPVGWSKQTCLHLTGHLIQGWVQGGGHVPRVHLPMAGPVGWGQCKISQRPEAHICRLFQFHALSFSLSKFWRRHMKKLPGKSRSDKYLLKYLTLEKHCTYSEYINNVTSESLAVTERGWNGSSLILLFYLLKITIAEKLNFNSFWYRYKNYYQIVYNVSPSTLLFN